jgi:hypothetical protein
VISGCIIHSKKKGAEIIAARRVEESNGWERRSLKKLRKMEWNW